MVVRNFFLIVVAVYLGGCCGLPTRSLSPRDTIPKGESVVFGEVSLGPEVTHWFTFANLYVIDTTSSKIVLAHQIGELREAFYWHLPPGRYAIVNMDVHNGLTNVTTTRRINAEFSVDRPSQLIYVGNLQIDWRAKGKFVTVVDDYDNAVTVLHSNYQKLQDVPIKRLLELEEDL